MGKTSLGQSIARALPRMQGLVTRGKAAVEYLRALRYELRMLPLSSMTSFATSQATTAALLA